MPKTYKTFTTLLLCTYLNACSYSIPSFGEIPIFQSRSKKVSAREIDNDLALQPEDEVKNASLLSNQTAPFAEDSKPIAPVQVSVAQAFFDNRTLNVKVHLKTLKRMSSNDILVGITGLRNGVVVEQDFKRVSEVFSSSNIDTDSVVAFRFRLNSPDLSEYQVKCIWGEGKILSFLEQSESLAPLAQEASFQSNTKMLEIKSVDIESMASECKLAPCDLTYTLHAELENKGQQAVHKASLAVGLYWVNEGQLPSLPNDNTSLGSFEELVELSNLEIASGDSQKIKVTLDRSVPQVPGGSFIPHIRLLK